MVRRDWGFLIYEYSVLSRYIWHNFNSNKNNCLFLCRYSSRHTTLIRLVLSYGTTGLIPSVSSSSAGWSVTSSSITSTAIRTVSCPVSYQPHKLTTKCINHWILPSLPQKKHSFSPGLLPPFLAHSTTSS